jgi:hypothetical protein
MPFLLILAERNSEAELRAEKANICGWPLTAARILSQNSRQNPN